jgi:hypothetical protein
MSAIAQELDRTLRSLDPQAALSLTSAVNEVLAKFRPLKSRDPGDNGWPAGYFEATAGAFAEEPFERPEQREPQTREDW